MTQTKDKIALIDIDETLAGFEERMREQLLLTLSPADKFAQLDKLVMHGNIHNGEAWLEARKSLIKSQPGFWRNLPVIDVGMRVYHLLGELGYSRMILTKGPKRTTAAWTEKVEWCAEHVPEAGIMVVRAGDEEGPHKGLVYGTVLFDDYPDYIMQWLKWRHNGRVLMLDNPHNRSFHHPQVFRVPHKPLELLSNLDNLQAFLEAS